MKTILVAVACRNASGMADMPVFHVPITEEEYALGVHYDKAEALAADADYERPFVCFDDAERDAIVSAARTLDLVPRIVAVDVSDGLVHSVRCDAGEIKVICYDESDTDESSESVVDIPVGADGDLVKCWAHIQVADVDPGLAKARD